MTVKPLKPGHLVIYGAICAFWRENGYSPGVRDLMAATSETTTSQVHRGLRKLEAAGYITFKPETARSIVITRPVDDGTGLLIELWREVQDFVPPDLAQRIRVFLGEAA